MEIHGLVWYHQEEVPFPKTPNLSSLSVDRTVHRYSCSRHMTRSYIG